MALKKLSSESAANDFKNIALIATDIDGTLTTQGRFSSKLLSVLENLQKSEIRVLLITGRSAGWCQAIVNYLPVWGVIAENGGVYCDKKTQRIEKITPITNEEQHRQELKESFEYLQTKFPNLKQSSDNQFRLTDWTFECHSVSKDELREIEKICQKKNWGFTYSHIQGHLKPQQQNKAKGLLKLWQQEFPSLSPNQIVTVGDSPNDESLFEEKLFPISVGVANIVRYSKLLGHQPSYVSESPEIEGFCELAQLLLKE